MGWVFRLNDLLAELNERRTAEGRAPLTWAQVGSLLGMSRQALQNLASNRELKVTNTRFLEAFCRFFGKEIHELIYLFPPLSVEGVDQDEIDRLIALGRELEPQERPEYHVDVLYDEEAALRWRVHQGRFDEPRQTEQQNRPTTRRRRRRLR
jgi:transcriptional regulator with XRE-family HTH domain